MHISAHSNSLALNQNPKDIIIKILAYQLLA